MNALTNEVERYRQSQKNVETILPSGKGLLLSVDTDTSKKF